MREKNDQIFSELLGTVCILGVESQVGWGDFNPFMLNGHAYPYQLDQPISVLRAVGCYVSFLSKF